MQIFTQGNSSQPRAVQTKAEGGRDNVNTVQGKTRKGKAGQMKAHVKMSKSGYPLQSQYPTPPRTSRRPTVDNSERKMFLFDDESEISAWIDAVAAAGPAEKIDETVILSDNEKARRPIQDWTNWRHPYKQPKKCARFCSSDWPMYLYSKPLWT
jgi:hypothetical protein